MNEPGIRPGQVQTLAPGVRRLTAPNASPMTGPGTNSYILGTGPYLVVDPAVDEAAHLERLWQASAGDIAAILLTHRHPDHAAGAAALARRGQAPIRAWPKPVAGEHDVEVAVSRPLADGEVVEAGGIRLTVLHTPGHAGDHLCFELPELELLLAGDTLMTDATVVILPPDGAMGAYFETLARLASRPLTAIAPAHGALIEHPVAAIAAVRAHRRQREADIAALLAPDRSCSPAAITARLYPGLGSRMQAVARRQVVAHLLHLGERGAAEADADGWRAVPSSRVENRGR